MVRYLYKDLLLPHLTICSIHQIHADVYPSMFHLQKRSQFVINECEVQHDLRAVFVCGTVEEGRNYLFIFGLGNIVTYRIHELQRNKKKHLNCK